MRYGNRTDCRGYSLCCPAGCRVPHTCPVLADVGGQEPRLSRFEPSVILTRSVGPLPSAYDPRARPVSDIRRFSFPHLQLLSPEAVSGFEGGAGHTCQSNAVAEGVRIAAYLRAAVLAGTISRFQRDDRPEAGREVPVNSQESREAGPGEETRGGWARKRPVCFWFSSALSQHIERFGPRGLP